MAGFQVEEGTATGRGFAGIDSDGYCAKFMAWSVMDYASGGPNWYLHDDFSSVVSKDFAPGDVNTGTEVIAIAAHGYSNGHLVRFSTTGGLPGGISAGTDYWISTPTAGTVTVHSSYANFVNGVAINLTSQGTGTHTMLPYEYFAVFCDTAVPSVNDYNTGPTGGAPKFLRVGYCVAEAGWVRVQSLLWWNATTHTPFGFWAGYGLATYDSASFAYNFRGGGATGLVATMARLGTSWSSVVIDDFIGDTNFLEDTTHIGVLQSGITAGSSVVLQLGGGQAANFSLENYYYLIDMSIFPGKVDYVRVTARDLGLNQITIDSANANYTAGAIIGSYPHRFYCHGSNGWQSPNMSYYGYGQVYRQIPYCSSQTTGYEFHNQIDRIRAPFAFDFMSNTISSANPNDKGEFGCQRPTICESRRHNDTNDMPTDMNRSYGITKNVLLTTKGTMAQMQDYRTKGGLDWIFYREHEDGTTQRALMILHTESAS